VAVEAAVAEAAATVGVVAEAVGFMRLLPMVAGLTRVMDGVAMH
jgi:hypothetical protein